MFFERRVGGCGVSFLVQQRDDHYRWRTVAAADTRPVADGLAQQLREALIATPYVSAAAVRVVTDAQVAQENRISDAARLVLSRL